MVSNTLLLIMFFGLIGMALGSITANILAIRKYDRLNEGKGK